MQKMSYAVAILSVVFLYNVQNCEIKGMKNKVTTISVGCGT